MIVCEALRTGVGLPRRAIESRGARVTSEPDIPDSIEQETRDPIRGQAVRAGERSPGGAVEARGAPIGGEPEITDRVLADRGHVQARQTLRDSIACPVAPVVPGEPGPSRSDPHVATPILDYGLRSEGRERFRGEHRPADAVVAIHSAIVADPEVPGIVLEQGRHVRAAQPGGVVAPARAVEPGDPE